MSMKLFPLTGRILVVNFNRELQELFHQAFPESGENGQLDAGSPCDSEIGFPQMNSILMGKAHSFQEAYSVIEQAKKEDFPYSLVFIQAEKEDWTLVQEGVQKLWECDGQLRCVCCLPSDITVWPSDLSFSRPWQSMVVRTPVRVEEIRQLSCCLLFLPLLHHLHEEHPFPETRPVDTQAGDVPVTDPLGEKIPGSKIYVDDILRSMADALLVIRSDLTIGAVNPSLLQLLEYEEDELIGQSPGSIFGEEFARGSIMEDLLLQGSVSGVESSFLTKNGREIPISVSGSMMQDEEGQFQGLVCVAQDITERKRMEEEKVHLHEQLLNASRQLGMAEVASDVLHNVGNVLNSINVSIGVVSDLVKQSLVGDVGRVSQLFQKHQDNLGSYFSDNPKGKQIPAFLEKLSEQLMEEKRVALLELDRLRENAQHAQHCVAAQQDLAKPSNIVEPLNIISLCEDALSVNQEVIESMGIEILRDFQEIPLLIVDKHITLQILVDVVKNACQAMEKVPKKQLIIRAKLIPGPPDSVSIEVQDSGVGIASEDLIKIFGQGTGQSHGGRGQSLHSGALMAKNLQGSLRADSAGLGQGATFSLALPGNFHFPDL